ncbi:MAG TPA: hypothetical protein VMU34_18190 [Mycobacterium sp.]|nr:hypothetical protein [Mycobacterium sp.]
MTPDELIRDLAADAERADAERADAERADAEPLVLHPLVGGMPLDEAWKSLHLLTDHVLPALRKNG